jgi:UDP-N-acetylmuramate--alanine ligase
MKGFSKHNVFFVGIGGIGMSALARWFNAKGFEVIGYDKTATNLTQALFEEGIMVHYQDSLDLIPAGFTKENTLVIFTPAIPDSHSQLNYFIESDYEIKKRAEVLGMISSTMFTVAVAGTHGKTTTSSMIAHILKDSGVDTTAFLGGIATNYNSNLLLGESDKSIAVIEADEYDRSFLQLSPDIEIITSVDADHLDIYGDESGMLDSYKLFYGLLQTDGKCLISAKAQETLRLDNIETYGIHGHITASNLRIEEGRYKFDYVNGTHKIEDIRLNLPGEHNTENAIAAIAVATTLGVGDSEIKHAFESFKGIKRRFEYILELPEFTFIDDYAHHPAEIAAFIKTLKALYPEQFIQVIFQPHLFTRTRDFADEFATSLSIADSVILMDIYPARELPIEGVTAEIILNKIAHENKNIMTRAEILAMLENQRPAVLATIGAGNIDALVPEIKELITKTIAA